MFRSDETTRVLAPFSTLVRTHRALSWRGGRFVLLTLFLAACGSDGASPKGEDINASEADDSDDESGNKKDAGKGKDAGKPKDAGKSDDDDSEDDDADDTATPTPSKDAGSKVDASKPKDAGVVATTDSGPTEQPPTGDVCAQWKAGRANLTEGKWTGDVASCNAGDITQDARDNALRALNMYRALAGLKPLTNSVEGNRLAQGCALMMKANNMLSHMPPTTWTCYTAEGAKTAGSSSISGQASVGSVEGYMIDPGNPTTIGHRRWILSNWLTEVGFGSTDMFSCQYQPAAFSAAGGKAWAAWPPAGQVPVQSFGAKYTGNIDQTGWTVQSDTINLSKATVTVTSGGADKPVTVTQVGSGYGSMYAFRFNPMGWTSKAGETYSVKVAGVSTPIEYDVQVVDCP
jgi:uncharacterized protein YkwD